mmetsp:Transcript_31926/g.63733  ORF Transcript_31926/g.63733 Transcript_31926/m.63733 type:complete len:223 (+) Transcript_31926:438-1106(+)
MDGVGVPRTNKTLDHSSEGQMIDRRSHKVIHRGRQHVRVAERPVDLRDGVVVRRLLLTKVSHALLAVRLSPHPLQHRLKPLEVLSLHVVAQGEVVHQDARMDREVKDAARERRVHHPPCQAQPLLVRQQVARVRYEAEGSSNKHHSDDEERDALIRVRAVVEVRGFGGEPTTIRTTAAQPFLAVLNDDADDEQGELREADELVESVVPSRRVRCEEEVGSHE